MHEIATRCVADLLVDGEEFGRARLLGRHLDRRHVAEGLQGAADVEPLVDHLELTETQFHRVTWRETTDIESLRWNLAKRFVVSLIIE